MAKKGCNLDISGAGIHADYRIGGLGSQCKCCKQAR